MLGLASHDNLSAVTDAARRVCPWTIVGLSRQLDDGRVSLLYDWTHGAGEFVVRGAEVPDVLRPTPGGARQLCLDDLSSIECPAVGWHLRTALAKRVASIEVPGAETPTRFWIGLGDGEVLDSDVLTQLLPVARQAAMRRHSSDGSAHDQLQRLERAAELLPLITRALDVREVFDHVAQVSRKIIPHDMLVLGLFSDDLTTVSIHAGADDEATQPYPVPYPAAVTESRTFEILDDRSRHPLEAARRLTQRGMRSSLRLTIRFGDRVSGGLALLSREPRAFSIDDVAVGIRLSHYVGIALSHQRLAEQTRRDEELRARAAKSDLLDELLASVTLDADLAQVFDRVSAVTQKVMPHDTLLLVAVRPGGRDAKVYASRTPEGALPFPEVVDLSPYIIANPGWESEIVPDMQADPAQRHMTATHQGYRAVLRIAIRFDNEYVAGLSFLSFTPNLYTAADVPAARRIADRVALSFARQRGAILLKRADEATAMATRLESRVRALTEELDARTGFRRVVGTSPEWRRVLTLATQVASTEATVLLLGESGTGKEVVARFLHRASERAAGPFVALNCAALPEHLLEAELFGYERGAYTGAIQSKPGQLEQAAGGTLFLDEVGEMSLPAQAKFLRVLQEREFQRLGGTRVLRTDARIVAATNRDLERAIALGQFREDLYYRLNVFAILLPALRDRPDDVLTLSEAFLLEIGRGLGRPASGISREARQILKDYRWPGNVRELRNILERAAILADGGLITREHLSIQTAAALATAAPAPPPAPAPLQPASASELRTLERTMIEDALRDSRFNKSRAARTLGLTRQQLYVRMRRYGLE